jgi:hypothetical protein
LGDKTTAGPEQQANQHRQRGRAGQSQKRINEGGHDFGLSK